MIGDGRSITGLSLDQWTKAVVVRQIASQRRIKIPPLTSIAEDAPPVLAFVNYGHWKAFCPNPACGGAEDIWREGPWLLFCLRCGNRAVGGRWVLVTMPEPAERDAIEERLAPLHRHEQNWEATEGEDGA